MKLIPSEQAEQDRQTNYIDTIHPSIIEMPGKDGVSSVFTYRWALPDGRAIYLYITLTMHRWDEDSPYILATANGDSEEVRGQGKHLWQFLKRELRKFRSKGFGAVPPLLLVHEEAVNQFSLPIVQADPDYHHQEDNNFWAIYK